MKPTLEQYIKANEYALASNPPVLWPQYQENPADVWRYIAHLIGHGFAAYSDKEVLNMIGALYGRLVVKTEIGSRKGVTINSAKFVAWLREAWQEAKDKNSSRDGSYETDRH